MKREGQVIDPQRVNRLSEASEWLLRLQAPERTEAEYNDWLRWCDADPENFAAFENVQRKWHDLDALKSAGRASQFDDFNLTLSSVQKTALLEQETDRLNKGRYSSRQLRGGKTSWAIAAGIAAVAFAIAFIHYQRAQVSDVPQQIAATVINRVATLPDGSKMILGVQSLVNMDFNGPQRQLDLSSGEAYFKVKHDKARPFVVQAGEVSVTAIGTAFDVRRDRDKVTVTVEEGVVEVRGATPGKKDAVWRAEAGYQLTYSTQRRTASLASVNPSTALSWRNGELAYLYEPLGSVVDDLNRYSTRKIVIADPQVARITFTGTAFAASLDGWLAGVKQAYPIDIKELATGEIILTSRE